MSRISCRYWRLGSSASDWLLFCASHFFCRCAFFVVFVGEGERVPLLLHHLVLSSRKDNFKLEKGKDFSTKIFLKAILEIAFVFYSYHNELS